MAEILESGAQPTTYNEYLRQILQIVSDVFGDDLATDPETPQGQFVISLVTKLARVDQEVLSVAAGNSPYNAIGSNSTIC